MIYLRKDRTLERIDKDCDKVTELAGFTHQLSSKTTNFKDIIGYYKNCKEAIPCGLTDCHKQHKKGFVIATSEGEVTNLGHVCGTKLTGIAFDSLAKQIERDVTEYEWRETLRDATSNALSWKKRCGDLLAAATPYNRTISQLKKPGKLPEIITQAISKIARNATGEIRQDQRKTDDEINAEREMNPGHPVSPYRSQVIGHLAGYSAWTDVSQLREILAIKVPDTLKRLTDANPDILDRKALKALIKAIGEIDTELNRAAGILDQCKSLVQPENLLQFLPLLKGDGLSTKLFRKICRDLPHTSA